MLSFGPSPPFLVLRLDFLAAASTNTSTKKNIISWRATPEHELPPELAGEHLDRGKLIMIITTMLKKKGPKHQHTSMMQFQPIYY